MNVGESGWPDMLNTSLAISLVVIGLFCMLTRRNVIKQIIGIKIMLQGIVLNLVNAAKVGGDPRMGEAMVISALVVETVIVAVALALIVNVFRHYPSGDVDRLDRLKG